MTKPPLVERLRDQRERHLRRPRIVRAGIAVAGFTLLLAGIAMLVLPGPALAVIPVALAILSLEFAWAARWLETALEHAERAKGAAKQTSPAQRFAFFVAVGLAVAAACTAAILWDIPVLPV